MRSDDFAMIIQQCADHGCEELASQMNVVFVSRFSHLPPALPNDLEVAITNSWAEETKKMGKESLNNTFVYCTGYDVKVDFNRHGTIGLHFGITDWKHYNTIKRLSTPLVVWGVGTAAITYFRAPNGERTYVFATRDLTKVADVGGRIEMPPGGYIDILPYKEELMRNCGIYTQKVFTENLKREFEEELGIPQEKVKSLTFLNLVRIPKSHDFSVDYILEVDTIQEELHTGFLQSRKYCGEHSNHFFVPEHALRSFVEMYKKVLTPRTKSDLKAYLIGNKDTLLGEK